MKREDYIAILQLLLSQFQSTIENKHDETWRQTYYNLQETLRSFLPTAWVDGDNTVFNDTGQLYLENIEECYLLDEWFQMVDLCQEWTANVLLLVSEA